MLVFSVQPSLIHHSNKIYMLVVMQISDYLVVLWLLLYIWEGYSDLAVLICVMWVGGQCFHLRDDWTLSCALWSCLEMPRMLLAVLSFVVWHSETLSLEEKLEVTCKCYFQHEGLQFVVLPQLCALKKQSSTCLCLFFFLPLQIPCLGHASSRPLFLAFFQLLYSLESFQIM